MLSSSSSTLVAQVRHHRGTASLSLMQMQAQGALRGARPRRTEAKRPLMIASHSCCRRTARHPGRRTGPLGTAAGLELRTGRGRGRTSSSRFRGPTRSSSPGRSAPGRALACGCAPLAVTSRFASTLAGMGGAVGFRRGSRVDAVAGASFSFVGGCRSRWSLEWGARVQWSARSVSQQWQHREAAISQHTVVLI